MKSNLVKSILDGALCASMVFGVFFFVRFYFASKQLRAEQPILQVEAAQYQNSHGLLKMLITDTAEYNKAHPDPNLARILDSIKATPAPAPAPGAAQKPPGK